jgi:hypothetical protein
VVRGQELLQVAQALREAQEKVLAEMAQLAQALGLAAAQVEEFAADQQAALEWDLQPLVVGRDQDLLGPGPLVEL